MKNKNYMKLLLDILMSIIFVLLFNKRIFGGLSFHEIAGLGIGLGILVHIVFNFQWVKNITMRLFDKKLPTKIRVGYLINLLLFISMFYIILSGVFISKVIFPCLGIGNERWFKLTHILLSYVTLVLLGVHIGLHGKWIMTTTKRLFRLNAMKSTPMVAKLAVVILLLLGTYGFITTDSALNHLSVNTLSQGTASQGQLEGERGERQRKGLNRLEGDFPGSGSFAEGQHGRGKGQLGSTNPLGTLAIHSSIMGIFAVLTYYLEKLITRRKSPS